MGVLVEALTTANLVSTLNGTGPFTVFAPTDTAFNDALAALSITKAQLLAKPDLPEILKYHVVSGKIMSTALTNGQKATTLHCNGHKLNVTLPPAMVNDAKVTTADVDCSNGVIHIINKVLLPASTSCPTGGTTGAATGATTGATTTAAAGDSVSAASNVHGMVSLMVATALSFFLFK